MTKAGKFTAWAAIVCIGVSGAAALYWAAHNARQVYQRSLAEANREGVFQLRTVHYHTSLLSSDAVTVVTFNTTGPPFKAMSRKAPEVPWKNFRAVLASHISHLPRLSFNTAPVFVITTRLDDRDRRQAAWLARIGGHDPLQLITRTAIDGASSVLLRVRPVTYRAPGSGESLHWGGLQGRFALREEASENNGSIRGALHSTALTIRAGTARIEMGGLHYEVDGHLDARNVFSGRQSAVIDGLRIGAPAARTPESRNFSVGHIVLQNQTHVEGTTLSLTSGIRLTDLAAGNQRIARFNLRMRADHLGLTPLAELRDLLDSTDGSGKHALTDPTVKSRLQEKLQALLAGQPRLQIQQLLLDTGAGTLKADLALRLVKPPPAGVEVPVLYWLTALDGEAHLAISETLLRVFATAGARARLLASYESAKQKPPAEEALTAAAHKMVKTQLAALEARGILLHRGDSYATRIELSHGEVRINGESLTSLPANEPSP